MRRILTFIITILLVASSTFAQENEPDNLHPSDEARQLIARFNDLPLSGVLDCARYEGARTAMQALRLLVPLPAGVSIEDSAIGGVPGAWFTPENAPDSPIIYYLHGGGYITGSLNGSYRSYIARLALHSGLRVFAIDYRLAPENPYPAALEDSLSGYSWLLNDYQPDEIIIAGDSAGGNLSLATMISLRDSGGEMPAGVVLISPWLDMTLSGTTIETIRQADPVLSAEGLANNADCFSGEIALDDPSVSPLFADFSDLPPTVVHVGTNEILLSDAIRFTRRAENDGVDVSLSVWDGLIHVWPLYSATVPEGQQLFKEIGTWITQLVGES